MLGVTPTYPHPQPAERPLHRAEAKINGVVAKRYSGGKAEPGLGYMAGAAGSGVSSSFMNYRKYRAVHNGTVTLTQ